MNYIKMTKTCDSCLIEHGDTLCRERIEKCECTLMKCDLCRLANDDVSCEDCKNLNRCLLEGNTHENRK